MMVSVVIPVYNGAQYIRRSVQSVLDQTYQDFELIVVDDGSQDGGGDLVHKIEDPRMRLVRQGNLGVSAARNRGIAEARGKYIAFLDADDEWDVGFLSAVSALSNAYPQAGLFGTGYRMVYAKGPNVEITAEEGNARNTILLIFDYLYRSIGGALIQTSGVMIPRKVFDKVGTFKVGEKSGEDLEMWARIALHFPIAYDTRIMFSFHQTPIDKKPRAGKLPKYEIKVKLLSQSKSAAENSDLMPNEAIRLNIKCSLRRAFVWYALNAGRAQTLRFMDDNDFGLYAPLMNRLIRVRILWPLLTLISKLSVCLRSRAVMKITKGRRITHGVMIRLAESDSQIT